MAARRIVIDVPEKLLSPENTDEKPLARKLRILAAVKLYELGRLSSGRAAELAGMPRVGFLLALERYRAFPLEAELCDLENARALSRHGANGAAPAAFTLFKQTRSTGRKISEIMKTIKSR